MAGFVRVQPWHDTAAGWLAADPILRLGEIGVESDTGKTKRGDGSSVWSALEYTLGETAADTAVAALVSDPESETAGALGGRFIATVGGLTFPTYAPHRGGGNIAPEATPEAFDLALALGLPILDMDVWATQDGAPYVIHDQTLDRTTTLTGNVSDRRAAEIALAVVDAPVWHSPAWPNSVVMSLDEVLRRYGGRAVLSIEIKDARAAVQAQALALLQRYRLTRSVLISSYSRSTLTPYIAAGVPCMLLNDSFTTDPSVIVSDGSTWMGTNTSAPDTQITAAIAAGLKVCVYTVNRHSEAARLLGLGVHMIMGDDPLYVQNDPTRYRRTSDSFASGTWGHGIIDGRNTRTDLHLAGGELILTGTGSLEPNVLLGELSPVANPAGTYSVTATVRLVSASTWGGVAVAVSTDAPLKSSSTTGYEALIRNTGSVELYRVNGTTATSLGSVATTAVAAGGTATLKLDVTPTQVSVTRTDVASTTVTATDSTYRGGYVFVAKQNAASEVRYSAITVA